MIFGPTHYNVLPQVRTEVQRIANRHRRSWNTYTNHPQPYWLDDISVDFWGARGRGQRVGRIVGWKICRDLIRRAPLPICYIRWRGRIWHPKSGWYRFNPDGIGHYDHVHVTFDLYSHTGGTRCPWAGN